MKRQWRHSQDQSRPRRKAFVNYSRLASALTHRSYPRRCVAWSPDIAARRTVSTIAVCQSTQASTTAA